MRQPRLRRSLLITPGHQLDRIGKAAASAADAVVMDIEDGVSPEDKPAARRAIREALFAIDFRGRERIVRVNAVGSAEHAADLAALELARIDALFVPKVELGDRLRELTKFLDGSPEPNARHIEIIATIETPRGLLRALEIADASARTTAIFFGSGDYTAATGSEVTERSLAVPRALVVAAAAAAGIDAIDAAYFAAVRNADAARADAVVARELGFAGKLVFHPNQIAPVNEVFTPSAADVAKAHRIVEAYEAARAEGRGTAVVDGVFIAIDIALIAKRVIARAALTGTSAGASAGKRR